MKKQLLTDCYSSPLGNSRPSFLGKGLILSSLVMGMFWGSQAVQASTIFNQSGPFTGAPLTPTTFTDSDALDLTNTDVTISACVYQTQRNFGYSSAILAKRGSENGWLFALNGEGESNEGKSGAVKFRTNYQANGLVVSNQTISLNTWSHVAVVYQNGQAQIFVNGGNADVTKTLPRPVATEKVLRLGGDYDYPTNQHRFRWNGTLSNLQIDNTALSQAQIQTLCTGCGGVSCYVPPPPPPIDCNVNPFDLSCSIQPPQGPTYNPATGELHIPQMGFTDSNRTCDVYLLLQPSQIFMIDAGRLTCD